MDLWASEQIAKDAEGDLPAGDRSEDSEDIEFGERDEDFYARFGARDLTSISKDPPPPLLLNWLAPDGHTILFGPGGVGKGLQAAIWARDLAKARLRVLILDYEDHPTEWSRRIDGLYGEPMPEGAMLHVAPLNAGWTGMRGPIWDQKDDIKAIADRFGADFIVIDSIVPACIGVDASGGDTQGPSLYAGALQFIGLPVLSLAHVPKDGSTQYPFGSAFWHNFARITVNISKAPDGESHVLEMKKHNNYPPRPASVVTVTWKDGLPRSVRETSRTASLQDQIDEVLDRPMTFAELTGALNERADEDIPHKKDSIAKALQRGLKDLPKRYANSGGKWMREGYEPPLVPLTLDGTEVQPLEKRRGTRKQAETSPHVMAPAKSWLS